MLQPTSIRIFYEVGKCVAIKAKGAAALVLATGFGAAAATIARNMSEASKKAHDWVSSKINN